MASFKGTGTAALSAQAVTQKIGVSRSNLMTLSSYGTDQVCHSFTAA